MKAWSFVRKLNYLSIDGTGTCNNLRLPAEVHILRKHYYRIKSCIAWICAVEFTEGATEFWMVNIHNFYWPSDNIASIRFSIPQNILKLFVRLVVNRVQLLDNLHKLFLVFFSQIILKTHFPLSKHYQKCS